MNTQQWSIVVAGVGIVAALAGAITNSLLARSSQRQQWIRDKKMQEYRELLDGLALVIKVVMEMDAEAIRGMSKKNSPIIWESLFESVRVVQDRIFIAHAIQRIE